MRAAEAHQLSSTLASQRWTVKTSYGFFAATAVRLLQRLTTRCATDLHCGRADGGHRSFPVAARSRVERHQDADLSDAHPTRCIRAGVASGRLSLPTVAVLAGL